MIIHKKKVDGSLVCGRTGRGRSNTSYLIQNCTCLKCLQSERARIKKMVIKLQREILPVENYLAIIENRLTKRKG